MRSMMPCFTLGKSNNAAANHVSLPSRLISNILWLLLSSALVVATHDIAGDQSVLSVPSKIHYSKDAEPRLGAVSSESAICSRIGTDILLAGGNAADSLVATSLCVGVVAPYHSGIGGGGFMLIRSSNGSYEAVDFRESAPAAADENMYQDNIEGSVFGGLSAGTPGELKGLEYLHQRYGKLSWSAVMRPAIQIAKQGFVVNKDLVRYMHVAVDLIAKRDFLVEDPAWAEDFAPNGTRLGEGDLMTRRRYAKTLETVSLLGSRAFYSGSIARATVKAVRAANGIMTMEDLQDYNVVTRTPLKINYKGYRLITVGAPAGGAVVLSAFKTIESYDGMERGFNLSVHRLDEAIRFGYAERASLGDPTFVRDTDILESNMLDPATAAKRRSKISDKHTLNVSDYSPDGFEILENHGTSHIVTADVSGMAVTYTSTVNLIFGSGLIVPETGVIMNDEMNDFSIPNRRNEFGYPPSPSNFIRPGKRPMSSISPVIVEHLSNSSLYYVAGSAGGSRIITAVIQNLWHVLDRGLTAYEAIREPRFHDQLLPNIIQFEWGMNATKNGTDDVDDVVRSRAESGIGTGTVRGFDNHTVSFMKSLGHNVSWVPPGFSSAQALRLCWNGTFEAASEPRQLDSGGFAV